MARKHDETYKLIFSQRAAVEELIRNFVGKGLADERDPTPENLQRVLRGLIRRFRGPEFAELQQALYSWIAGAAEAWQIPEADLARMMSFTEDEEMYERAKELRDQVHRDGVRQGRIRERALVVRRFATRKFGAETAERPLTTSASQSRDVAEHGVCVVPCERRGDRSRLVDWILEHGPACLRGGAAVEADRTLIGAYLSAKTIAVNLSRGSLTR